MEVLENRLGKSLKVYEKILSIYDGIVQTAVVEESRQK